MNFKRIYISFFHLLLVINLSGQIQNPFEIKSRLQNSDTQVEKTERKDTSKSRLVEKGVEDSAIEQSISPVLKEATAETDQSAIVAGNPNNPFEVDQKGSKTTFQHKVEKNHPEMEVMSPTDGKTLRKVASSSEGFLFWVILLAFFILAVGLSLDRWYITKLFKGILNYNLSNTMMREATGFKNILLAILYLLFMVSASIFVYLSQRYITGQEGATFMLYSFAFVFAVYFIRHIAMHFLYYIYPELQEALIYSYSIATFNIVAGIALLIPVLLMAYSPNVVVLIALILGLSIVGILYLLRSFRGLLIAFKYLNNTPIQFFLYLCAFEIVPLLVLYKIMTDFI